MMLTELRDYYAKVGILSTDFHCANYDQCRRGGPDLIQGKSAFIGAEYEKHTLPRVLFVSLDPGSDQSYETPQKRTPTGVREIEENRNWEGFNPLLHWYATHKFSVLAAQEYNPKYSFKDANLLFAHSNCVKCCEDKKGNDMSNAVLYRNCRSFIGEELQLLDPDIIIGQGGEAQKAVEYSCEDISGQDRFNGITTISERIRILKINNHLVLYIKFIYPSWRNDRTRKQEKELYPVYLSAVKIFLAGFYSQSWK